MMRCTRPSAAPPPTRAPLAMPSRWPTAAIRWCCILPRSTGRRWASGSLTCRLKTKRCWTTTTSLKRWVVLPPPPRPLPSRSVMASSISTFSAQAIDGGLDRPKVSAIEILSSSSSTNTPPTANAGPDQSITLPANSVTLSGSGTDPGGAITAYSWTKVSGGAATITSPSAASTTVTGLAQGSYVFRLTVTDNGSPGLTGSDDVTVTVNGTTTATTYRINAGGPQLSTSLGTFAADNFFSPSPGYTFSTTSAIAGTTDDALYQTERSSTTNQGTFGYAFPVANGSYTVVLHFAEIYWTAVGKRVFDVSIENQKVLDNYDIFKKVGGFTATTETFAVTVSDGILNINFSAQAIDGGLDRPKVSAIEILSSSSTPIPHPPPMRDRIKALPCLPIV